ncbi:unnamed protein product, partial [Porites lobata]
SLEHRLANFLILNRSTPHTVTWQSPAELFLGRQIRNCFTLPKPNLNRAWSWFVIGGVALKGGSLEESLGSCEGEEDSNYARNFLSSQAEVKSGVWSPSEPPVNTSEAGGVPDAGDVEEQDTTEVTPESSLGDALEGASPSGTPLSPHPA